MFAVVIKMENSTEGVQVFSTRDNAVDAVNRWERDIWESLDTGEDYVDMKFPEGGGETDPDDSYGGWTYEIFPSLLDIDTA